MRLVTHHQHYLGLPKNVKNVTLTPIHISQYPKDNQLTVVLPAWLEVHAASFTVPLWWYCNPKFTSIFNFQAEPSSRHPHNKVYQPNPYSKQLLFSRLPSSLSSLSSSLSKVLSGMSYSLKSSQLSPSKYQRQANFNSPTWSWPCWDLSRSDIFRLSVPSPGQAHTWQKVNITNNFHNFQCLTNLTIPQALSMLKLICWPNSMGLNCCVPRITCLELSFTLYLVT